MQKAGCRAQAPEDRGRGEGKGNVWLYSNMEASNAKTNISCTHKASLLPQVISKRMSIISEYFLEWFFFLPETMSIALFRYVLKQIWNKAVLTVSHALIYSDVSLTVAIAAENVSLRETRDTWVAGGDKRKAKLLPDSLFSLCD